MFSVSSPLLKCVGFLCIDQSFLSNFIIQISLFDYFLCIWKPDNKSNKTFTVLDIYRYVVKFLWCLHILSSMLLKYLEKF